MKTVCVVTKREEHLIEFSRGGVENFKSGNENNFNLGRYLAQESILFSSITYKLRI